MNFRTIAAVLTSAALLGGCASTGAIGSFRGASFPVMLGPKDRVGMTTPAPVTKIDDWFSQAVHSVKSLDTNTTRTTTEFRVETSYMGEEAVQYLEDEHKSASNLEMRITTLTGVAYVTAFGGAAAEYVRVETDIVKNGDAK